MISKFSLILLVTISLVAFGENKNPSNQHGESISEEQREALKELREENIVYSRGAASISNRELLREEDITVFPVISDDSVTPGWQTRDIIGGSDLDQDGLKEIIITDYQVHGVHIYELIADNTLEWVATLDDATSTYGSTPRQVITGDLDGNGREEIIFSQFRDPVDPNSGINVWEWDGVIGSDNYTRYVMPILVDGVEVDRYYGNNCLNIGDVDQDGQTELLIGNNGSDHAFDICLITHVEGEFESGTFELSHEYIVDQNSGVFNGSPGYGQPNIADLDGDGDLEAIFSVWDHATFLFLESPGPDVYDLQSTLIMDSSFTDQVVYGATHVADIDGDGIDEIYGGLYPEGWLWQIKGGDDVSEISYENNLVNIIADSGAVWDVCGGDVDTEADGVDEIFSVDYDHAIVYKHRFNGLFWQTSLVYEWEHLMGGFTLSFAGDLDGDGAPELLQGFLEPPFTEGNPLGYTFAIIEWNDFPPIGDVNGDYLVDVNDLTMLLDFIVSLELPDGSQFVRADFNNDGLLDVFDAVSLVELLFDD